MNSKLGKSLGGLAACIAAASTVAPTSAQEAGIQVDEIVVTGSLIRGTPEDAALPVDSISADDLDKQGSPPALEMLKGLSYMNGIVGESNQFTSRRGQAAQGSASVNLRGFGASRTLVLLNGKRLASEDANRLPSNAIARVEVLKDGGAVTYGSDAIGGVVNYITKENIDGFELSADYRAIDDSDGDYNLGATWGFTTDNSDFFASLNWYHRSELAIADQDWALTPYEQNPEGGWSTGANPGSTTTFVDPQCELFGGVITNGSSDPNASSNELNPAGSQCRTRFTEWDNLVEEQDSYQGFASYNITLGDDTDLHLEALYAMTDVPHANSTPSYTTVNYVPAELTGGTPGTVVPYYVVPSYHPAIADMDAQYGTGTGTQVMVLNQWRPFFAGGNPRTGYKDSHQEYERENYRLSAELTGLFGDSIGYTTSLSYSQAEDTRREFDIRIDRLQLALLGFGGENCAGGIPGVNGCQFLNPFSNAIPNAPTVGAVNPGYNEALANDPALVDWMTGQHESTNTDDLVEFNFVLDGEMGAELGGGAIGWAAGVQYRHQGVKNEYNEFADQTRNPCALYGDTSCVGDPDMEGRSPWTFLATYTPYDLDREVKAVFGEMFLPFTDNLTAQLAARYEDYGKAGGDSFDPSVRLRWQTTDWLAFRASAGTTFRAAPLPSLNPVEATGFSGVLGVNRPVSTTGNPDLEPEESTNYNLGVMFSGYSWDLTVDYWRFEIDKLLTTTPLNGVLDRVFPNGASGADNCGVDPAFEEQYFDFAGGTCSANNIVKVKLNNINGASITNDGIDIQGRYTWDEVGAGSLSLGGSATWINTFETDTLIIDGAVFEEGFDGVGKYNSGTTLFPLPEIRGNVFLDYAMDRQNLRWTIQYIDSYDDERNIFATYSEGQTIDSIVTHNLTYRIDVTDGLLVTASVDNLLDEEPPFARTEINYDAVTHNPIGRSLKVGVKYQF